MADHRAFAKRLQEACDNNDNVPPLGKGQQTWLSKRLGVSQEAVRRWFNGESRPRPQLLSQLAALLDVSESWLALAKTDVPTPSAQRAYSDKAEGAVYICFGLFKAAGYECAFADISEPFDFHAIKKGRHFFVSAMSARPKTKNIYNTSASNFEQASHFSVVFKGSEIFEVVYLPWLLIQKVGRLTSDHWELELRAEPSGGYTLNGIMLERLGSEGNPLGTEPVEGVTQ